MTKNIAQLVWDTVEKEMGEKSKNFGTDTTHNGENAFLYMFQNDDVDVEIVVSVKEIK